MPDEYCSRCPFCGDFLLIRINSIDCVNIECGYTSPRRSSPEDCVECRKVDEPRFVPPKQIKHPNVKDKP
jgi:hypothetical protein